MPPTRHRRLEHFFAGWPSQTWSLYARNTGGGFGRASVTPSLWAHMSVESISLNSNMTGAGSNGVLDSVSFPQTGDITSPPVRDGRILATQGMGLPDGNFGLAGVTGPHVLYTPIAPVDESTPHLRIAERAFAVTYAAAIVTVTARRHPPIPLDSPVTSPTPWTERPRVNPFKDPAGWCGGRGQLLFAGPRITICRSGPRPTFALQVA